jgi:hypothetical protein
MKKQKRWSTVNFFEGEAMIELTINHDEGTYYLSHGDNDQNITFKGDDESTKFLLDRAKCCSAAIKYAAQNISPELL